MHDFLIHVFVILGFQNAETLLEAFHSESLQIAICKAKAKMDAEHTVLFEESLRFAHSAQSLDQILRTYARKDDYTLLLQQAAQYTLSQLINSRGIPLSVHEQEQLHQVARQMTNKQLGEFL